MKKLISLLMLCFLIPGCRNDQSRHALNRFAFDTGDRTDTTSYPLFIDGGRKIVYQVGHLTADMGLKLYFDTIPYPEGGLYLDDSVRHRLSAQ